MTDQAAHFQRLAWRVVAALPDGGAARSILVTSVRRGEGRSYVAAALAAALREQTPRPVALCDCAQAPPAAPALEHATPAPGQQLLPVSGNDMTALPRAGDDAIVRVPFGGGDLSTLSNGAHVRRALDVLGSHCGFIVLDGPLLADCGALGAATDGTLVVINARRTRREIVQESLQTNPRLRAKILGVVLNEAPRYIPNWLYRRAL